MEKNHNNSYWFLFYQDKILVKKEEGGKYSIPFGENPPIPATNSFEVVLDHDIPAHAASVDEAYPEDEQYLQIGLRASWDYLPKDWYKRAGKAYQLVYWDRNSQYCPACGSPMTWHTHISKYCPKCKRKPIRSSLLPSLS